MSSGFQLGTLIAERLMAKPAFQAEFADARRELIAAGIATR